MLTPGNLHDRTDILVHKTLDVDPSQAKRALGTASVCLRLAPEVAADRNGQIAVLAAANTLGRTPAFVPCVRVSVPAGSRVVSKVPFLREGGRLQAELVGFLRRVAAFVPTPTRYEVADQAPGDLTLVIGGDHGPRMPDTLYASYTGWTATIAVDPRMDPIAARLDPHNPIGACLAGTWGAAEIIKTLFTRVKSPSVRIEGLSEDVPIARISAWQGLNGQALEGPHLPDQLRLNTFSIIGAGAVGDCVGFVLSCLPAPEGVVHVCDFDVIEPHSGNRLATAFPEDVGHRKSEHLARVLSEAGFFTRPWNMSFDQFARETDPAALETLLVGVDNEQTRRDCAFQVPKYVLNSGTIGSEFLVSSHLGPDEPCLACLYPGHVTGPPRVYPHIRRRLGRGRCGQALVNPQMPAGTIAFVSLMPSSVVPILAEIHS